MFAVSCEANSQLPAAMTAKPTASSLLRTCTCGVHHNITKSSNTEQAAEPLVSTYVKRACCEAVLVSVAFAVLRQRASSNAFGLLRQPLSYSASGLLMLW
jgi:hypothetical protein